MTRTLRQATLAAISRSDLPLRRRLVIFGGLLRPATSARVYEALGEHCQAAGWLPYAESHTTFTADTAISAINWDAIIKFIQELIPLIELLIGLFPAGVQAADESTADHVHREWTRGLASILLFIMVTVTATVAMAHGPSGHLVTSSMSSTGIPANYQPRWQASDGLSFYDHAKYAHGIDVRGKSFAEVAWLRDEQHDRYGMGHPFASPLYQQMVRGTSQRRGPVGLFRRYR